MIKVKEYKAFHGVMKVTPKGMIVPTFELEADWLYIPDKKVWIANDVEYSEEICTVVRDDTKRHISKKPVTEDLKGCDGSTVDVAFLCPECGDFICFDGEYDIKKHYPYCHCGLKIDWSETE